MEIALSKSVTTTFNLSDAELLRILEQRYAERTLVAGKFTENEDGSYLFKPDSHRYAAVLFSKKEYNFYQALRNLIGEMRRLDE